jgi:polar amino acid transport system permease protein
MPFGEMLLELLSGLLVSVEIFVFTPALALPLGLVVAGGRMAKNPFVSHVFRLYISVVRGTPLMLQILFVYFAPYYVFGCSLARYPRLLATVLAFSMNYAAYFAEIYRGGILSIDRGQWEAAKALGLSAPRTFLRIILPQTVKRVIPAIGNEVITLVKDTSLAFTIAVTEMFTIAKQLSSANTSMAPLIAAGVFYYVFNFIVAWTMERIERHYAYYS